MCGIVGYVGPTRAGGALPFLTDALKRLEYRGYDSAGVATVNGHGVEVCKSLGKIATLESLLRARPPAGRAGIGHTRWATHGRPSDANSHPHLDCTGGIAVVHNGIIENDHALRARLLAAGHRLRSETDSELVAHLIEEFRSLGLPEAVRRAAALLHGSFAIACVAGDRNDTVVAIRGGDSPLVVGRGDGEVYLASDVPALLGRTREAIALEDGDLAVLGPGTLSLHARDGRAAVRVPSRIDADPAAVEKAGYPHFMLKEIWEQPAVVRQTLDGRLGDGADAGVLRDLAVPDAELARLTRVRFVASGSSWHAALVGRYLVETVAGLPAEVDMASEVRDARPGIDRDVLLVPISQSGETADTLAATRCARLGGARVVAVCNVAGSSLARTADDVVLTRAGIEVSVAATKSFTAQLTVLVLLALRLAGARGGDGALVDALCDGLRRVPGQMTGLLARSGPLAGLGAALARVPYGLFIGRGLHYPIALEGALKLKEIAYVPAEGLAAGELKHGPIALLEQGTPVVALAPAGRSARGMAGSIREVRARDARVIALTTEGDEEMAGLVDTAIPLPAAPEVLVPLLSVLPLQLLAYHAAVHAGRDVDQPRNLAKSVTVE